MAAKCPRRLRSVVGSAFALRCSGSSNALMVKRSPFIDFFATADDSPGYWGSCRKPPGALYLGSGRERDSFPSVIFGDLDLQRPCGARPRAQSHSAMASRMASTWSCACPEYSWM